MATRVAAKKVSKTVVKKATAQPTLKRSAKEQMILDIVEMSKTFSFSHAISQLEDEMRRRGLMPQPQEGKQTLFYESTADIAIYGGAAGSGKTHALLMEPLKHIGNPDFSAVFFRREMPQHTNPGGMWDESTRMYAPLGAKPTASPSHIQKFPSGAKVLFSHLQLESTVYSWDGAQIPLIAFDQLEHFTKNQFFYMLSRNRSMSGVKPYIRATCNPMADTWLAEFIAWWIDPETGYPIQERAGIVRWFKRVDDAIVWGGTKAELMDGYKGDPDAPEAPKPQSCTFIPGTIYDNPILIKTNPGYLARLLGLNRVERERLLGGNWKIRAAAGLMFRREWCETVKVLPADVEFVRYWDRAATEKNELNDPDWTVGLKAARSRSTGIVYLCDVRRMRASAGKVEDAIRNTGLTDGTQCRIGIPQDPGQAGKSQVKATITNLGEFSATSWIETGDKVTRFGPFSAQAEVGNVKYLEAFLEGPHADAYLSGLENFPDADHKDDADATSGMYAMFFDARGQGMRDFVKGEAEKASSKTKKESVAMPDRSKEATGGSSFMEAIANRNK